MGTLDKGGLGDGDKMASKNASLRLIDRYDSSVRSYHRSSRGALRLTGLRGRCAVYASPIAIVAIAPVGSSMWVPT